MLPRVGGCFRKGAYSGPIEVMKAGSKKTKKVLVVDVGGTHVKALATGHRRERKILSGLNMTASKMVEDVKRVTKGWVSDSVSIGYPGPVVHGRPLREPYNLGRGWVGFDFVKAFGCPVKVINDAAMQALGSYQGGRMLFLGLGAGLGSTMILDGVIAPMELGHLAYKNHVWEHYLGEAAQERLGHKRWERMGLFAIAEFTKEPEADS